MGIRTEVVLEGSCLHSGRRARLSLARAPGPVTFEQNGRSARLDELRVVRSDLGVALSDGAGFQVDLVEHLLAALGGTGVRSGLRVGIEGSEVPLLDGGAVRFCEALRTIDLVRSDAGRPGATDAASLGGRGNAPHLRIARAAELRVRGAVYRLAPADSVELSIEIAFDHPAIRHQHAKWGGSAREFEQTIAPARTFGFVRDAARLAASGRAGGVIAGCRDIAGSVVVFDDGGVAASSPMPTPNEPARHKLLDMIGDLYLYGGPPLGMLFACQPGHTATHEFIRRAIEEGIVANRCNEEQR